MSDQTNVPTSNEPVVRVTDNTKAASATTIKKVQDAMATGGDLPSGTVLDFSNNQTTIREAK